MSRQKIYCHLLPSRETVFPAEHDCLFKYKRTTKNILLIYPIFRGNLGWAEVRFISLE